MLADLKFCPILYLTKIWTVLFHSKMTLQQKSVKQILVNSAFKSMCKVPKKIKIWQLRGEVLRLHHLPPPHPCHHLLLHPQHLISHHPILTLMVWNRPYVCHCYAEIRNQHMVQNLVENLYAAGCFQDFMLLVTQLASGKLSPLNIAFLLCLECARWQSLKSTTQMTFRDVTKKFWLVVYRLLKGKGICFFSGPKNYGQVISKTTTRGNYDPEKSDTNFAVPDERYLLTQDGILG